MLRYDNLGLQDVCGGLIGTRDGSTFLRLPFIAIVNEYRNVQLPSYLAS